MISRINFDTSKPHDIAKNIQVQAAVFEMKARIYEM